jgi:hypothetical protein
MRADQVNELFDRIGRLSRQLSENSGSGAEWDYAFSEGEIVKYKISNVKSPEEIKDNIAHLFIWIWSMKDYIKNYAKELGKDPKTVENFVNNDQFLPVCSDIANREKHGDLNKSRSGKFAIMGELSYTTNILRMNIGSKFIVRTNEIDFVPVNPSELDLSRPIFDLNNNLIGDAFDYLLEGIKSWENLYSSLRS